MPYKAFVLTSSDSCHAGTREDLSGPAAMDLLREAGYEIAGYALLPDEFSLLTEKLITVCDSGEAELLITTGGTGFSPRDCMPEATLAAAGIRKDTLIVNLPGSPKAVRECLGFILPTLEHAIRMMQGGGH